MDRSFRGGSLSVATGLSAALYPRGDTARPARRILVRRCRGFRIPPERRPIGVRQTVANSSSHVTRRIPESIVNTDIAIPSASRDDGGTLPALKQKFQAKLAG
jgi:hypothetical protein